MELPHTQPVKWYQKQAWNGQDPKLILCSPPISTLVCSPGSWLWGNICMDASGYLLLCDCDNHWTEPCAWHHCRQLLCTEGWEGKGACTQCTIITWGWQIILCYEIRQNLMLSQLSVKYCPLIGASHELVSTSSLGMRLAISMSCLLKYLRLEVRVKSWDIMWKVSRTYQWVALPGVWSASEILQDNCLINCYTEKTSNKKGNKV